jgi:hypothetical protein
MLALRILTLPIAMAAFMVLYTTATKAPAIVEIANLILWIILPFLTVAKLVRTIKRNATRT